MRFEIPGKPIPWSRAGTNKGVYFDPQYMAKKNIRALVKEQIPDDFKPFSCPLKLVATFYIQVPKALPKYKKKLLLEGAEIPHAQVPDTSNLIKFLEDCFSKFLFDDDKQIWNVKAKKVWAIEGRTCFELIPS